jgi:hypothetical protein
MVAASPGPQYNNVTDMKTATITAGLRYSKVSNIHLRALSWSQTIVSVLKNETSNQTLERS